MAARKKWSSARMQEAQKRAGRVRVGRKKEGQWHALIAELSFVRECIKSEMLRDEPMLAETTWLSYRYMSAFERTELFTTEYESAFRRLHGQYKSHHEAEGMMPIHPEYACNARDEMTSLWKARQCADALGVPYSLFIRVSMDKAINRHYGKVPRPNQLCTSWQLDAVETAWATEREIAPLFAESWDPRFFAPSTRDDPVRRSALDALVDLVHRKASGNRAITLANYLFRRFAISEPEARLRFDDDLVDEATKLGGTPSIALPLTSDKPYLPHCLGMQQASPAPQCIGCSFHHICLRLRAVVDKECINQFGTDDPQKAREREQGKERKRKQRANEKALLLQSEV